MTDKKIMPVTPNRQTFVQTERKAHIALGKLTAKHPSAGMVLNTLVGLMDRQCAVCISHDTLSKMLDVHPNTVKRGIKVLKEGNWIQQIQLGPRGTVNCYLVNSRVAWADRRDNMKLSRFHAVIIADADDQDEQTMSLKVKDMQKVPFVVPPEEVLPSGDWPNGETGYLEGTEPIATGQHLERSYEDDFPAHLEDRQSDLEDFSS